MRWFRIVAIALTVIFLVGEAEAQQAKKTKSKKKAKKSAIQAAKPALPKLKPTRNLNPGSVGYYFYPTTVGSHWKLRTVKSLYGLDNKLVASDTLFSIERVTSTSAVSLQGFPLVKCESRAFREGMEDRAPTEEVTYYVDDSLIMAVFNNSINHNENRSLLTVPLQIGSAWPEKWDDSVGTEIVSLTESVTTPAGEFNDAVVTVTRLGFGELVKYFVPGSGIVKMVFRGPTSDGHGNIVVMTDLIEVFRAPEMGFNERHMPAHDGQ